MGKRIGLETTDTNRSTMAKHTRRPSPELKLRVRGAQIRPGRIPVPELIVICQSAQAAVNRQAEALEGRQTLRPGPPPDTTKLECTLELLGIGKGSAVLAFDQAKPQQNLPNVLNLGQRAIAEVVQTIEAVAKNRAATADPGVLSSLREMGELFTNGVSEVEWIIPGRRGRKRKVVSLTAAVQKRIVDRLRPPRTEQTTIDGIIEMADFRESDYKCRIHPSMGPSIICTFDPDLAESVYAVLRKAARVEGDATINTQTGRMESLHIRKLIPLDPLTVNASDFITGLSLDELAKMQAVRPLRDPKDLAGGWPDDEDVDVGLLDIYQHRD
jgi:hypothetical protein